MDRRDFFKLTPAFASSTITASLLVREQSKPPVELDVSVLKIQSGDTLVLQCSDYVSSDQIDRIRATIHGHWPGIKAMFLANGLTLEGVLRKS